MTNTVRISTKDYTRREDGEVVSYRGDLGNRAIRYSRELSFWPWGRSGASLATGTIELDNRTGFYDQLVFRDLRDQDLQVLLPTVEGTDIVALTAIVDSTEAPDDRSVRISLKDTLTLLDVPLQDDVYGDDADETAEGRPLPITLGVARTIRPLLWEAFPAYSGPAYRLHDAALSGAENVRDKGITLNADASPPEWQFDERIGAAGITLDVEPIGVVTLDVSSSGDAAIGLVDELNGDGSFRDSFTGFTDRTSIPSDPVSASDLPDGWGRARTNDSGAVSGNTWRLQYDAGTESLFIKLPPLIGAFIDLFTADGSSPEGELTAPLTAGKSYRYRIRLVQAVTTLSQNERPRVTLSLWPSGKVLFSRRYLDANNQPGLYFGNFIVPEGADQGLRLRLEGARGTVKVNDLEIKEAFDPGSESTPSALQGITLRDYSLEIVRRVGLSDSRIVTADIDAIDPDDAQIGIYLDEPITALGVLRAPLDSYCADVYSDRQGRFRFAQLRDVSEEIPDFTIDASNLVKPPRVRLDQAEGLTTSIIARRNYYQYRDADFADNPTDIPLDLREKLKARGQFQRNAALPDGGLPTLYRHAVEAEPLLSIFDTAADALTQIQRVVDLYEEPRFIVEAEIWVDPGEFIELNTVCELTYPRYGFDAGKQFLVVGVTDQIVDQPVTRSVQVRLWG